MILNIGRTRFVDPTIQSKLFDYTHTKKRGSEQITWLWFFLSFLAPIHNCVQVGSNVQSAILNRAQNNEASTTRLTSRKSYKWYPTVHPPSSGPPVPVTFYNFISEFWIQTKIYDSNIHYLHRIRTTSDAFASRHRPFIARTSHIPSLIEEQKTNYSIVSVFITPELPLKPPYDVSCDGAIPHFPAIVVLDSETLLRTPTQNKIQTREKTWFHQEYWPADWAKKKKRKKHYLILFSSKHTFKYKKKEDTCWTWNRLSREISSYDEGV